MAYAAAIPIDPEHCHGLVATFVVPAPAGCNLACPYCFIAQRQEPATATDLRPDDYRRFIADLAAARAVDALCIQGYEPHEPLLPESWPWTVTILMAGRGRRIPTSIVTNGWHLAECADDLAALDLGRLYVSIDAATAAVHNQLRGKDGAHERALAGIREALTSPKMRDRVTVTSVLMPWRHHYLIGMPKLLEQAGVQDWHVTPLQQVSDNPGPKAPAQQILEDARTLEAEATRCGIRFTIDDEFHRLKAADPNLRFHRLRRPGGVFRLLPSGHVSCGLDMVKPMRADAPRWQPDTSAAEFAQEALAA